MKIAFIYDVPYPWHVGGIEAMNYNEAEELAKHHEVHYFTRKWPGMESEEFKKNGIIYHASGDTDQSMIYKNGRRSIGEAIAYAFSINEIFNYKFDLVITNQFPILHLPVVRLYCAINKAKLIIEVAEVWDAKYWRSYLGVIPGSLAYPYSQLAALGADAYVTISSATTENLKKFGISNGDANTVRTFAPAIDDRLLNKIRSIKVKQRNKTVIFSGRLIKEKRVDKWIDLFAIAHAKDKSIRGLIIGKGPEKETLEKKIKNMGLSKKIAIRGFFDSNAEFYKTVRLSSVMLHMSEREGLGIIAIESIALGTPVVLPTYTPLPKEVKEMCVVADESKIPALIVAMAKSKTPQKYIKNTKNLAQFSKSKVNAFYSRLFKSIKLRDK
ncbi:MAG: glycosyltransferase [Candidatus Micrarchaeota archaeon]|nr:glycosyltransferase [Candidatus Micrarchaeota archaeon]MDE1834532.1 glycosyltransferase [Candidatus Micrarchaeota archaeon]MDE1859086.1 glycosyltransferase [Candidatus Micrarchaeota archaeon]